MKKILGLVLCVLALPAAAHAGHTTAEGFAAGLAHPFMGLDHLLAMVGIGMWSRRQEQPLALTFVVMMAVGALLQAGFAVTEGWIAASMVATGLLLAAVRMPLWSAMMVVSLFALLHGQVHGHELPGLASGAGFLLACAVLLGVGLSLGRPHAMGWIIACSGLLMLARVA